jgi:hypothetical protein
MRHAAKSRRLLCLPQLVAPSQSSPRLEVQHRWSGAKRWHASGSCASCKECASTHVPRRATSQPHENRLAPAGRLVVPYAYHPNYLQNLPVTARQGLCTPSPTASPRTPATRGPRTRRPLLYSHSIVPGGLEVMSYTTRLTVRTLLQMRLDTSRRNAGVKLYQSAVMPSPDVTARSATTWLCVRWSPCADKNRGSQRRSHRAGASGWHCVKHAAAARQ